MTVFTVGHSNHPIEHFLDLLRRAGIRMLVDVRSSPVSGYCPHFDKQPLQRALRVARVQYLFLGAELGGRPPETEFYDAAGYVLYDKMARSARFRAGVQRLLETAAQRPTVGWHGRFHRAQIARGTTLDKRSPICTKHSQRPCWNFSFNLHWSS